MNATKLKPELEQKLKRLRTIRNNMIGRRKKFDNTLPKHWYEYHKSNR